MFTSQLNKSIIVEKENTTINDVGTPIETYQFLKETYARISLQSGDTSFTEDGALPYTNEEFLLRYDDRINYKCRFQYENQYYMIKHIKVVGRKDWMKIKCIVWEDE